MVLGAGLAIVAFAGVARDVNSPAPALAEIERIIELAGLGITQVSLTGHRYTPDSDIFDALDLASSPTMVSFDSRAAQRRIESLPWVERASVERVLPDRLDVHVVERAPYAVWRLNGRHFLVDKAGHVLATVPSDAMPTLPRVAGEGAAIEAMLNSLDSANDAWIGRIPLDDSQWAAAEPNPTGGPGNEDINCVGISPVDGKIYSGPDDDPVLAILGGDDTRGERVADRRHMRHLRCFGDVAIGAETVRQQPGLVQTPQAPGDEPMTALYRFRRAHGLPPEPRHIIYSLRGCLDLAHPIFNTPGVEVIVVTNAAGETDLRACGIATKDADLIVEPLADPQALRRAHTRLFEERGVRYLDCEGGQTVLRALHRAGLLDEIFLTETDVVVDESRHAGVLKIFDFEQEGADLIAEGRTGRDSPWRFRRWRFNRR